MSQPDIRQPDIRAPRSSRESGSAYILVLLVLLVLTLLGLVLAFITQSEVEVGANERTVNRVFYSAEAGVTVAVTNLLIANDRKALNLTFMDPGSTTLGTHVAIPAMQEVNSGWCNLCEVNQGSDYRAITHDVQVTATRFGVDGGGTETVLATKNLELMVEFQPFREVLDVAPDQGAYK
ncbi:MAG: PilX N-terminal domain-containing pilus assembly protein [Thermoanaerobaculia bacterium]